jgi:hypothetical protein
MYAQSELDYKIVNKIKVLQLGERRPNSSGYFQILPLTHAVTGRIL